MAPAEMRQSGIPAVLAAAALFGTTGTVLVNAPSGADAFSVGALRLLVGGATLAVFAALARRRSTALRRRPSLWSAPGAIGVAVFQLGYFLAVERTGVAVGTVVTIGSGPVLSGVAHALAGRRLPNPTWLIGTTVGITGVALLGLVGHPGRDADPLGIALAVLAGAGWATFASVGRREIERGVDSTANMAAMFCGGAALVAPVLLWHRPGWVANWSGLAVVVHLGVFTVGVAYWLYGIALRHLSAPTVITLTLLEPITAAALGRTVVGERVGIAGWVGIALVVVGLYLTGRTADRSATQILEGTVPA